MALETLDLTGCWQAVSADGKHAVAARVPGDIHGDLLAAGAIPDPFYRDNEKDLHWIGEADWTFSRSFDVPAALLAQDRVLLRCEGLDTLATVRVNGHVVGEADNMHRTWEFDVGVALRPGANEIAITLRSAMRHVRALNRKRALPGWGVGHYKLDNGGWIRKEPCNFGWDWGPALVTCGIWREIRLVAFSPARLRDVQVRQTHARGAVRLAVSAAVERTARTPLRASVTVRLEGSVVARAEAPVRGARAQVDLSIRSPRLWWPNGMGEQPLYEVVVDLLDAAGDVVDSQATRVGLRTLRLVREKDRWGESFAFAVNGKPFFAKGANWIPADAVLSRLTHADYERLLTDAAAANMNMLRAWGGGIYEDDAFYDLCDELGLCVWQDFLFSCATYPGFDDAFLDNVEQEARDNVRRLRNHACIALWCGNNELEQGLVDDTWTDRAMSWEDYSRIFDERIPAVVRAEDPDRDYWPCSPHSPRGDRKNFNNPDCGDAHLWSVWHGRQPFEWYRTCTHRFNSEFGFQSFPEPQTVRRFTLPRDRNITSPIMEWHQRSVIGNDAIMQYMLDWFRMPKSFDMTLWLSQILQGMAMKYAVEHWRRSMPRGMGTLYWQLNDCWPVASWASIDGYGNWKALQYMARRFYAPVLISGLEDVKAGRVAVHVTNDRVASFTGVARWVVTSHTGAELAAGRFAAKLGERRSARVGVIPLKDLLREHRPEDLLVWLELCEGRAIISDNLALLARPKRTEWAAPRIVASVTRKARTGEWLVDLVAERPAPWTWLEVDGFQPRFSDNFVHLRPGRPVRIAISLAEPLTEAEFNKRLRVRSLADTY